MIEPKKETRKFYKSVITVTVLSEDAPVGMSMELVDIDHAITEGDLVGEVEITSTKRINRKDVVKALLSMNSCTEFFGLDSRGRDAR